MKKTVFFLSFLFIFLRFLPAQKKLSDLDILGGKENQPEKNHEKDLSSLPLPEEEAVIFTDNVPEIFNGIWEGNDRFILFQTKEELEQIAKNETGLKNENYLWVYLKTFYGWYIDRAAENNSISKEYRKDVNDTVFRDIQDIKIKFVKLTENEDCSCFEIYIKYPYEKEEVVIPAAVADEKLFLNFAVRYKTEENENTEGISGCWIFTPEISGIKVSKPIIKDSLKAFYVTEENIYYIRYWETDMPYTKQNAVFSDGDKKYEVPKHVRFAGKTFTCVTGRSLSIRNVEKHDKSELNKISAKSKDGNMFSLSSPYLTKKENDCTIDSMMKIVSELNARRSPDPDPPFPPSSLDWHMDDITRLELSNQIIQAVRKRQKEFSEKYSR